MNSIPRTDILSLDFKVIRNLLNDRAHTKFNVVKKENPVLKSFDLNSIIPWISSSSKQFVLSRHKIGTELIKHCRNGFRLDDPHLIRSRFFVNYHRLHDPALKRYYNSTPVKNRLKKLELLNERNDAICTSKEFIEYVRYLDSFRAQNLLKLIKFEVRTFFEMLK